MKRIIAVSSLFVLALTLTGCQAPAEPPAKVVDKEAASETITTDQQATLEVTEAGELLEQQASMTISEPSDGTVAQQEASLTIVGEATTEPSTVDQEASLTITE